MVNSNTKPNSDPPLRAEEVRKQNRAENEPGHIHQRMATIEGRIGAVEGRMGAIEKTQASLKPDGQLTDPEAREAQEAHTAAKREAIRRGEAPRADDVHASERAQATQPYDRGPKPSNLNPNPGASSKESQPGSFPGRTNP